MAVASSGTIPEARVFPREAANPHTFHGHETLAQFAFPLLSSFNTHQNMPLCLPRKVHAFKSPSELPSGGSPRRDGQGLAHPARAVPFPTFTQAPLFL